MKLLTIFITAACLHASATGISQTITFKGKDVPLEQVFTVIKKQSDYLFFYDYNDVRNAKKVTIEAKNMPLKELLDMCFRDQTLTYVILDKTIVISRKTLTPAIVSSPLLDISGRVVNENNEPVPGVTVTLKNASRSVLTNSNGEFSIKGVDESDVLVFSSVAYETQEVRISGRTIFSVRLKKKVSELDQTVVIGYGQTTKRLKTGNTGTVKGEDVERQPVTNPLLAMQGRVAGVVITQNSGMPGGGITVRIQGQNSINELNGNDPLYVIDGVPYVSQMLATTTGGFQGVGVLLGSGGPENSGRGNPLSYINPADIESIDILKDADATAIYGSRGANGVILITTRKGQAGQTKVDVNFQYGLGQVASRKLDLLNTEQYRALRKEAFVNDGLTVPAYNPNATGNYDLTLWDSTRYTDWQEVLIGGTASYTTLSATISGGSQNIQYLVNGTYHKETSVFPGNFNDKKGSTHFTINSTSLNQKFKFQLSGSYLVDKNLLPGRDLTTAIVLAPNAPKPYKDDGTLNWELNSLGNSTWDNPFATLYRAFESKTNNLVSSAVLSYKFIPALELKSSFGYTHMQTDEFQSDPLIAQRPENRPTFSSIGYYSFSTINSWIVEPQLNYGKKMGRSKVDLLIGATFQQRNSNGISLRGRGYTTDASIRDIKSAATISTLSTVDQVYKYAALFGRLNYNWNNKYILNLTARRDGSSRFGVKNRFHNFGAVGAGWIFSDEKLIQRNVRFLSFGKLRGSYGTSGNDQIADYSYMNLYQPLSVGVPYQAVTGLVSTGLPNPYLEWEETRKLQIGVDLGFFNNAINVSATYVKNRSSNQLLEYQLPVSTGASLITDNFDATVQNTAWELEASSSIIRSKKFEWKINANLTIPRNKLVSFPGLATSFYADRLIEGQPLDVTKYFRYVGVESTTGLYTVADRNGNPTSTPDYNSDLVVFLSQLPKFYGGLNSSIQIENLTLDFLLQFVKQTTGQPLFNNTPMRFLSGLNNQPTRILDRWQKEGDVATYQKLTQGTGLEGFKGSFLNSTAVYSDASYLRLRNLSISYQLSGQLIKRIKLQNCRLFVQGQNLFTLSNYLGLDPETKLQIYLPPLKTVTFGIQIAI